MAESPILKAYNKPDENILSTKKTPEAIQKIIESHGIDVADLIELKAMRDRMKMELKTELKTERQKIRNEMQKPEKPEKQNKPGVPEGPERPSAPTGFRIEKPEKPGKPENPPEVPGTPEVPGGQSSQPGGPGPTTEIPQTGGNDLPTSIQPESPTTPVTPGHIGTPDTSGVSPGTGQNPLGL